MAANVHLIETILRVNVSQRRKKVGLRIRVDVRNTTLITNDFHVCGQSHQLQRAIGLRERPSDRPPSERGSDQREYNQNHDHDEGDSAEDTHAETVVQCQPPCR